MKHMHYQLRIQIIDMNKEIIRMTDSTFHAARADCGKCFKFVVTINSAWAATAAARTWRSFSSFVQRAMIG